MPKAEFRTGFLQGLMGNVMAVWPQDPSLMCAASSSCAQGKRLCLGTSRPKLQVAENISEARISVYIAEGCSKSRRLSQSYDLTVP